MFIQTLTDVVTGGIFSFLLIFVRMGTALMLIPGIGDAFVSARVRLLMALAVSFATFPIVQSYVPSPIPGTFALFTLILMEFVIGLFMGTIARIFMTALDTAGMVISMQSGLANAQVFNPALASQGSLVGAFLTVTGIVFLFATNLHHLLILSIFESYEFFPIGGIPDPGSMAEMISKAVAGSFLIGVKIAIPFITVTLLIYTGMGVLARLMPQIQVFMLALPMQILLALLSLSLILSTAMLFWIEQFEQGMVFFMRQSGG